MLSFIFLAFNMDLRRAQDRQVSENQQVSSREQNQLVSVKLDHHVPITRELFPLVSSWEQNKRFPFAKQESVSICMEQEQSKPASIAEHKINMEGEMTKHLMTLDIYEFNDMFDSLTELFVANKEIKEMFFLLHTKALRERQQLYRPSVADEKGKPKLLRCTDHEILSFASRDGVIARRDIIDEYCLRFSGKELRSNSMCMLTISRFMKSYKVKVNLIDLADLTLPIPKKCIKLDHDKVMVIIRTSRVSEKVIVVFRPHGLLVYRLCLPPDTPIIFIFVYI